MSSGSRFDTWGKTDGRTDITKLTSVFREEANAPKNRRYVHFL